MKKFMMMALLFFSVCFMTGCVDRADMQGLDTQTPEMLQEGNETQVVETVASPIEGFRLIAGNLEELDTKKISMQTADGHALSFKLAPETLVYKGDAQEITPGDEITVVFEGDLKGTDTGGVSVIAVSVSQ